MYNVPESRWQGKQNGNHSQDREVDIFLRTFRPSRRTGNLWRWLPDKRTVSIFPSKFGGYCWCIGSADAEGPTFSKESYPSIEEAAQALLNQLEDEEVL